MQRILISVISSLIFINANSQDISIFQKGIKYLNDFTDFRSDRPDADSAYYCLQKLAARTEYAEMLKRLLHQSFVQAFILSKEMDSSDKKIYQKRRHLADQILAKAMGDTSAVLLNALQPLYLWKTIQDNQGNTSLQATITENFLKTQIAPGNIYDQYAGRYGLMIYKIISVNRELKPLAEKLLTAIYTNLEKNQIPAVESTKTDTLAKRAWYRYLFAYANFMASKNSDDKLILLKKASDFSPDSQDRLFRFAYYYDMKFLIEGEDKNSFSPDYLGYLAKTSSDTDKVTSLLLEIALLDPEYKVQLKEYYTRTNGSTIRFDDFWRKGINAKARDSYPIDLTLVDQSQFELSKYAGKWVLLDFWGTWCTPCRAEHPDLQKLYTSFIANNTPKIAVLTIACKDSEEMVLAYMREKKYTFPVAMSDGKIENTYPVTGYPTKLLITPERKFITIPYGIDWVAYLKEYVNFD